MDKQLHLRTSGKQLNYWQVAAIAQDYASLSEFVRAAIEEKAAKTQAVLDARIAVIEAAEAVTDA